MSNPENRAKHPRRLVGREHVSAESRTGYRTAIYDVDIPDRLSHEPSGIRAKATEFGTNKWTGTIVHGPHEERDESGSYYKQVGSFTHEGPLGGLKPKLKRAVNTEWDTMRKARG